MATSTRPTKIFEELSRSTLNKMAEKQKIELDEYTSKGALVDAFKELAEDQAIRMLTAKLSRNDLSSICESVEVEYEEGVKNPSKAVMTKRLKEKMRAAGLEKFLNKLDGEFLQKFAEYTDVEIEDEKDLDDKTKKRSIAKHVAQVVVFEGVQSILNTYNVSFLGDMCKELGLKGTTSTKSKLIYALATHTSPKHLPSFSTAGNAREAWDEAAEESLKRKKAPQIKKGVTYQDLFQWYGVEELKEWCSENKLKVSGTKKELCNRILAYFDGDLENTLAENSKSGRSRSRSRSRSKSPHRKPVNKKKSKEDEEGSKKTKKSDEKSKKSSKSDEEEEDSEPKNKKSKTSDKETKEKDNKKVTKSKSKEDKEEDEEEKEDKDEKKNKKGSKAGEKETSKKTKAEETDKKNKGKDETTDEKSNKKAKTTEESDNKKVTKSKSSEEKSKGKNSPKKGTKKGEDEEDDE